MEFSRVPSISDVDEESIGSESALERTVCANLCSLFQCPMTFDLLMPL